MGSTEGKNKSIIQEEIMEKTSVNASTNYSIPTINHPP